MIGNFKTPNSLRGTNGSLFGNQNDLTVADPTKVTKSPKSILPNVSTLNTIQTGKRQLTDIVQKYVEDSKLANQLGFDDAKKIEIQSQGLHRSMANKIHLIKLVNGMGPEDSSYQKMEVRQPKTFIDLCKAKTSAGASEFDVDDFLYVKNLGVPINRLITLRRFPLPCTDNIWDTNIQKDPDIARMVTYSTQETNKLEDLLSFAYRMQWKQLESEMDQASTEGPQSGWGGHMAKIMEFIDPVMANNTLQSDNYKNYNPKHDQNKVYGPVDSIKTTHIRDVGLEFEKEFDILFEYELRSIAGRTPEFAFKDVLANVLACTYNNATFWGGSRYWVGDRPSSFLNSLRFLDGASGAQDVLEKGYQALKGWVGGFMSAPKEKSLALLKKVLSNGFAVGMGKLLDIVGRPSIVVMDSLLSGAPIGNWHLTIGNPDNPTMCIGNLILMDSEISFPTDSLSYGDFPTKMNVKLKLKPAMPKDKAGIEMMFNFGKERIYFQPKNIKREKNNTLTGTARRFFNFEDKYIESMTSDAFDNIIEEGLPKVPPGTEPTSNLWINNRQLNMGRVFLEGKNVDENITYQEDGEGGFTVINEETGEEQTYQEKPPSDDIGQEYDQEGFTDDDYDKAEDLELGKYSGDYEGAVDFNKTLDLDYVTTVEELGDGSFVSSDYYNVDIVAFDEPDKGKILHSYIYRSKRLIPTGP